MEKFKLFAKTSPSSRSHDPSMNGKLPSSVVDDPLDRLAAARAQLKSVTEDEEDTGRIEIPSNAPPRDKLILGTLSGLTPNGRLMVILFAIAAVTLLVTKGIRLW
jgi:hypothetical protein